MFTCLSTLDSLHEGAVSCLSISPGDCHTAILISAGEDGTTHVIRYPRGRPLLQLDCGQLFPTRIIWINTVTSVWGWDNGMVLEMALGEDKATIYIKSTLTEFVGASRLKYQVTNLAVYRDDERLLIAASGGPEIQVWSRMTDDSNWVQVLAFGDQELIRAEAFNVTSITFRGGPQTQLAATFLGGNVYFWDLPFTSAPEVRGCSLSSRIGGAAWSDSAEQLAVTNLADGVDVYAFPLHYRASSSDTLQPTQSLTFVNAINIALPVLWLDDTTLVVGGSSGSAFVAALDGSNTPLPLPHGSGTPILAIEKTSDRQRIATGDAPQSGGHASVKLWTQNGDSQGLSYNASQCELQPLKITLRYLVEQYKLNGGVWDLGVVDFAMRPA